MRGLLPRASNHCTTWPPKVKCSTPLAYAVAVLAAVAATLVRASLTPLIGETAVPYITCFPAVLVVAWYGGFWPASVCTFLSALAADYFFVPPFYSFLLPGAGDQVTLPLRVLVSLGIALRGDSQSRAVFLAKFESGSRKVAEDAERDQGTLRQLRGRALCGLVVKN